MPAPIDAGLVAQFERRIAPVLQEADIRIEAIFVTEPAPNTFARLPVREGENLLAWFGIVEGRERSPGWLEALASAASPDHPPVSLLELEPTSRSVLGHVPRAASGLKHEGR
jgi:hypothetical protein